MFLQGVDTSASWSKMLGCHTDLYTVSRCHTRGESGFKTQDRHHQKSITGVLAAPRKGLKSFKKFKKKNGRTVLFKKVYDLPRVS